MIQTALTQAKWPQTDLHPCGALLHISVQMILVSLLQGKAERRRNNS